jgi:hypothetical protein
MSPHRRRHSARSRELPNSGLKPLDEERQPRGDRRNKDAAPSLSASWGAQANGWALLEGEHPQFVCPDCLTDEERALGGETAWRGY